MSTKSLFNHTLLVGVLFSFFAIAACSGADEAPQTAQEEQANKIPVRTVTVSYREQALPINSSGMLTSDAEQRLAFKVGGIIQNILVDEGDYVRPGQVLARLNQTEIAAQVNQAKEAVKKAERDRARVEALYKDSSATLELLENARTGYDIATEGLRIAEFNLQHAEIRAGKGGKVIKKLMNEGEICGPGTPVLVVFETGADDWIVEAFVSDRDWARIQKGMTAEIHLDAYPETTFTGKVKDLAPAADPGNGLYRIEVGIRPQGKRFAPGLFAQVKINPNQKRKYAILPIEAIMEGDGKKAWVFALDSDGESVKKVPVVVAYLDGKEAILEQIPGTVSEVISTGAPYLSESKKVQVVQD
jgi:RND family efflux transporter MFP subunit